MQPRLFPLQNTFDVGAAEKHKVTVRYTLFGRHVIWVDGKEVWNRFNWKSNYSIHVVIGKDERHDVELRVKTRPHHFSVWLDGAAFLDPLFPEVTLQRFLFEGSTTLARVFSVVAFVAWLLLGGVHETTPKSLLMIVICAVIGNGLIVMQYKKHRSWVPILAIALMVVFNSGKPRSQTMLFLAVFSGIIALLGPWLRKFVTNGQSTLAP